MQYRLKDSLKEVYLNIRVMLLSPFLLFRKIRIPEKKEIKTILLLRHDRVGDMVFSTPLFRALKKNFPDARLMVLASQRNYGIIENNPNVDEILIYNGIGWFIKEVRKRGFDLVIDSFLDYELKTAFLAYLTRAKYRMGFEISGRQIFFNIKGPKGKDKRTVLEQTLDLARSLELTIQDPLPSLYLSEEERARAWETLKKRGVDEGELLIGIHPGGYYESQRWPAEKFASVGDRLISKYKARVIIFGGEGDKDSLNIMKEKMTKSPIIIEHTGLRVFISLLSYCHLLLCNNSGPLHIATALKIPTVSTMGPTIPYLWWPAGENNIVLRKEIECSPCNKGFCTGHECMELITVDDMMGAVEKQLAAISKRITC